MHSEEEIFKTIKETLVEALGLDEDEVTEDATLVADLGAESIDFLDIFFRLEKAFDIKIPREELFPQDILTSSEFVEDGKLNEAGLAELKKRLPFADLDKFAQNPKIQEFGSILTVGDIVRFIASKVS